MSDPDNDWKPGVDRDDPYTWDEIAGRIVIAAVVAAVAGALVWWLI